MLEVRNVDGVDVLLLQQHHPAHWTTISEQIPQDADCSFEYKLTRNAEALQVLRRLTRSGPSVIGGIAQLHRICEIHLHHSPALLLVINARPNASRSCWWLNGLLKNACGRSGCVSARTWAWS